MYFGLFRKKLSIKQANQLLIEYCMENGFDNNTKQWKKPTHNKHLFAYHKRSNRITSMNWVSYHPTRSDQKYSVWIDLVSKEIREVLRHSA